MSLLIENGRPVAVPSRISWRNMAATWGSASCNAGPEGNREEGSAARNSDILSLLFSFGTRMFFASSSHFDKCNYRTEVSMGGGEASRGRQVVARNDSVTVTLRENLRHTCAARVLLILEVLGPSHG